MPDICCSRAADHDGLLVLLTMRSIQMNRHRLCRKTHAYAEPSPASQAVRGARRVRFKTVLPKRGTPSHNSQNRAGERWPLANIFPHHSQLPRAAAARQDPGTGLNHENRG